MAHIVYMHPSTSPADPSLYDTYIHTYTHIYIYKHLRTIMKTFSNGTTSVSRASSPSPTSPQKRITKNKDKSKHNPLKSEFRALLLFLRTMSLKALSGKFFPSPLPPLDAFAAQKVIVTGGTAGLGLAAAIHFLNLGADEVIITARSASSARAEGARQKLLAAARGGRGKVSIMELDMNSYASCVAFVEAVKGRFAATGGPDVIVFNAGVTNSQFRRSPEGM
jgi:hypothetical protein